MRERKDTPKKNNITKRKKNMNTNQIVIVNQGMKSLPIRNLINRKASLIKMTSQLKMLKNGSARRSTRLPN